MSKIDSMAPSENSVADADTREKKAREEYLDWCAAAEAMMRHWSRETSSRLKTSPKNSALIFHRIGLSVFRIGASPS